MDSGERDLPPETERTAGLLLVFVLILIPADLVMVLAWGVPALAPLVLSVVALFAIAAWVQSTKRKYPPREPA